MNDVSESRRIRGYVDGFNLYKGALQRKPHFKWLDVAALCDQIAGTQVERVAYCTAPLVALPNDPDIVNRQQFYLRALRGNPRIDIHLGKFVRRTPRLYRISDDGCRCCDPRVDHAPCLCCKQRTTQVIRFEEKGSDVQLGVQLVHDAHLKRMDTAVVISNDSDLQPAIDIALSLGVDVVVASPHPKGNSLTGSSRSFISNTRLRASQMTSPILDADGRRVFRPSRWQ